LKPLLKVLLALVILFALAVLFFHDRKSPAAEEF